MVYKRRQGKRRLTNFPRPKSSPVASMATIIMPKQNWLKKAGSFIWGCPFYFDFLYKSHTYPKSHFEGDRVGCVNHTESDRFRCHNGLSCSIAHSCDCPRIPSGNRVSFSFLGVLFGFGGFNARAIGRVFAAADINKFSAHIFWVGAESVLIIKRVGGGLSFHLISSILARLIRVSLRPAHSLCFFTVALAMMQASPVCRY